MVIGLVMLRLGGGKYTGTNQALAGCVHPLSFVYEARRFVNEAVPCERGRLGRNKTLLVSRVGACVGSEHRSMWPDDFMSWVEWMDALWHWTVNRGESLRHFSAGRKAANRIYSLDPLRTMYNEYLKRNNRSLWKTRKSTNASEKNRSSLSIE